MLYFGEVWIISNANPLLAPKIMINEITLVDVASYSEPVTFSPGTINYVYGSNGVGKSTLASVLAQPQQYPTCTLQWKNQPVKALVYNKDFVRNNFAQEGPIPGIFTLGEGSLELQQHLKQLKAKIELAEGELGKADELIAKLASERLKSLLEVGERCWRFKVKYARKFLKALKGHVGSKNAFADKCESEQENTADLIGEVELEKKYAVVFSDELAEIEIHNAINWMDLEALESADVFQQPILNKQDSQMSALIQKLGNADWVKEGVPFMQRADTCCPFCQQDTSKELRDEIESLFDQSYKEEIAKLETAIAQYQNYVTKRIYLLNNAMDSRLNQFDWVLWKARLEALQATLDANLLLLRKKVKNPSQVAELASLNPVIDGITELEEKLIESIAENNLTVKNLSAKQTVLKHQIWKFIASESKSEILDYQKKKNGIAKGVRNARIKKEETAALLRELRAERAKAESSIVGIAKTANEINAALKQLGYTNFRLAEAEQQGHYKLIRADGTEVGETLSEGEYTLITFVYFTQLILGSTNPSGISGDKVVVFDDPVSSLDSNVLFYVCIAIKEIIADCRAQNEGVKQIFILSHNVYFFKEVTFRGGRNHNAWKEEAFWVLTKLKNVSSIKYHKENPIKTTYELLWLELAKPDEINKATVFNTMRRILEYYFKVIGGFDYEAAIQKFTGEERRVCHSLVSWINDGSHFINDDLAVFVEPNSIEMYMKVFGDLFRKLNHGAHFDMMMEKVAPVRESAVLVN